jgi:hypothetical protein
MRARSAPLFCVVLGLVGCGGRSPMQGCPPGEEGCRCRPNESCDLGLVCQADICAEVSGSGGQIVLGHGGNLGLGGQAGYGGSVGVGGQTVVGGSVAVGGQTVVGGVQGPGGRTRTGGIIGSAGGVGSGGIPGSGAVGGNPNLVTFTRGLAQGALSGYAWVAQGSLDTLSSPTCGGQPIVGDIPCDTGLYWDTSNSLCITGSMPAFPAVPTSDDYARNWGVLIGVDAAIGQDGTLGRSYVGITFTLTGVSSNYPLRAVVHRRGDPDSTNYCATLVSGRALSLFSFNTACWDSSGLTLGAADVPNLDWVGIQVVSTSHTVQFRDLCLSSIAFN